MKDLKELLAEKSDMTVDLYEFLEDGKMNLIRILDPGIHISDEQLHINGLPGLKLHNLQIRIPYFDFICIQTPELPNTEIMIF